MTNTVFDFKIQYNDDMTDEAGACGIERVKECICQHLVEVTADLECESTCYTHLFHDALMGGGRRQLRPSPENGQIVTGRRFLVSTLTTSEESFFPPGRMSRFLPRPIQLPTISTSIRGCWDGPCQTDRPAI